MLKNFLKTFISILLVLLLASCTTSNSHSSFSHSSLSNLNATYIALEASSISAGNYIPDTNYYVYGNNGTNQGVSIVTNTINTNKVVNPAPQSVYQTQRWGPHITYTIPNLIANSPYTIRMHFAETTYSKAGARNFNVQINGIQVLTNFDIFQSAGGKNIALIEESTQKSNASGNIVIQMDSSIDNVTFAGIEIFGAWPTTVIVVPTPITAPSASTSSTIAPSANPTTVSSATPTVAPTNPTTGTIGCTGIISYPATTGGLKINYPVKSACFTANILFHHPVATLISKGLLTLQPSNIMATWWNHPYNATGSFGGSFNNNSTGGNGPLYFANSSAIAHSITCNFGGTQWCNQGAGGSIYFPSGATVQTSTDKHIASFDPVHGWEGDCWDCSLSGSKLSGAVIYFPFTGSAFAGGGVYGGTAGGEAEGVLDITAQDIINYTQFGIHIGHAISVQATCMAVGVFPSGGKNPEGTCNGNNKPTAGPAYGGLLAYTGSISPTALSSDPACQAVLWALKEHGAYLTDFNGAGLYANIEQPIAYSVPPWTTNPWTAGSNSATGINATQMINTGGCLQYVGGNGNGQPGAAGKNAGASNMSLYYWNSSNPTLPPFYGYGDARN